MSPVVPIVFYTGMETWNAVPDLTSLMDLPPTLSRFVPAWETLFLNLHRTSPADLTRFSSAVGYALRVLQAEREPLATLEQVLEEALTGLEGLAEEQAGQGCEWRGIWPCWYFIGAAARSLLRSWQQCRSERKHRSFTNERRQIPL